MLNPESHESAAVLSAVHKMEQALAEQEWQIEQVERKAELLQELQALQFNQRMHSDLQSMISTPILQFKGLPRQNTVDRVYDRLQRIDGMIAITKDPEQKVFLERLYTIVESTAAKHPQWNQYKKERNSPATKAQSQLGGYIKALAGIGLLAKSAFDFANKRFALGATQLGLALWINRVDKFIDPMRLLSKEVEFLHNEDSPFKKIQRRGVKGKEWSTIAVKIMNKQQALLTAEEQQKLENLGRTHKTKLIELLEGVKSDEGKKTVAQWIEHST